VVDAVREWAVRMAAEVGMERLIGFYFLLFDAVIVVFGRRWRP